MFILGTATTFAGAFLAACGKPPEESVAKTEVPVGGAVIMDNFIIAQPTEGNFVAYSAVCPHQGNKITQEKNGQVRCTAHGSVFDTATGEPVAGPTLEGLKTVEFADAGDSITVGGDTA
ncbi:Rieske (2Fe-2S) protein [Corynebacterium aquatimens]|nr:Rieske (2Fe-2S) protein [Corynebacterium aquatimens]WJY66930.1 Rieske [2Fe-2S] domain protein [Corynebacterium aquatimens]